MKRLGRWLKWAGLTLATLLALGLAFVWWWLQGSLPLLDGEMAVRGVGHPVTITRDAQGIATIRGASRNDIAYATGFLHAQERFFQMDLQRRSAAGELSELFGNAALTYDRAVRVNRFRHRANRLLDQLEPGIRALLEHYGQGVNAGLAALTRPPFEYGLLRVTPSPWRTEDTVLTIHAMYLVLQSDRGSFERALGLMADILPPDLYRFFSQQGGEWDAPLTGEPLPPEPIPVTGWAGLLPDTVAMAYRPLAMDDTPIGSNNWAVSGALTEHGGALVADDMHLPIRVPNIWYRVAWVHPDTGRLVSGASLPGAPIMVAGSNGRVAWGFTNTQGDWSDVVLLETNAERTHYATPNGMVPFAEATETVHVKGGETVAETVLETRWGPVIGQDHQGRLLAYRWVAHDLEGASAGAVGMETVDSVAEAVRLGPNYGIPHQNLVMGDDAGHIAWTIAGAVPDRFGLDGVLPQSWSDGQRGWAGYLDTDRHPRIVDPPSGRLWSANSRVLSGPAYALMGSQGAALGARQQQIRDALLARDRFDEADLLELQLDDRALFLARWRDRALAVLGREGMTDDPGLVDAQEAIEHWSGHAGRDDVGYALVRAFRLKTLEYVLAPLVTVLESHDPAFRPWHANRQSEYPAWALLQARPDHLLNPDFDSWEALEAAAMRAVVDPLFDDGSLADNTWGEDNRLSIRHPLAGAVPPVDWWLSMPDTPMPGDGHMPRVQRPVHGASERFGVSPGREDQAYFHMATGQSAHPLSPFFGRGHEDWVEGRFSPWLAGPTRHTLVLKPQVPD